MAISDKMKILIQEFVDEKTVNTVENFTTNADNNCSDTDLIAQMFGFNGNFSQSSEDEQKKQVSSFQNNLKLLIEKTWVEKDDVTVKKGILLRLDEMCKDTSNWNKIYPTFLDIIDKSVYLMFGQQTKSDDFDEYSLRIDPEFGIFWWFIQSLPKQPEWSNEKCRNAVLLGMYFLANY